MLGNIGSLLRGFIKLRESSDVGYNLCQDYILSDKGLVCYVIMLCYVDNFFIYVCFVYEEINF